MATTTTSHGAACGGEGSVEKHTKNPRNPTCLWRITDLLLDRLAAWRNLAFLEGKDPWAFSSGAGIDVGNGGNVFVVDIFER